MELVNMHCHTGLNGHGEGSIQEYIEAAISAGVTTLAMTEHYPLSSTFDPDAYLSMPFNLVDDYIAGVEAMRQSHPELEIILGCEFDWLGDDEDRDSSKIDLSPYELVLGSVHFVDRWAFDDPTKRERWNELGADYIWKRYFEIWNSAVVSDMPFDIMAHPDLPKKFAYYPTYDLGKLYKEAAEAISSTDRMIEVNTSGAYYACKEMFPAPELLKEFCRAGVPCTLGTDAHQPEKVDRDIQLGYKLMYDCGYHEVTVPMRNGDRRSIIIE